MDTTKAEERLLKLIELLDGHAPLTPDEWLKIRRNMHRGESAKVSQQANAALSESKGDLDYQLHIAMDACEVYFQTGFMPPPGPAWRIAVLLRKNGLKREESEFLRA